MEIAENDMIGSEIEEFQKWPKVVSISFLFVQSFEAQGRKKKPFLNLKCFNLLLGLLINYIVFHQLVVVSASTLSGKSRNFVIFI